MSTFESIQISYVPGPAKILNSKDLAKIEARLSDSVGTDVRTKAVTFRYTPLHDLESLCWMAFYVIIACCIAKIGQEILDLEAQDNQCYIQLQQELATELFYNGEGRVRARNRPSLLSDRLMACFPPSLHGIVGIVATAFTNTVGTQQNMGLQLPHIGSSRSNQSMLTASLYASLQLNFAQIGAKCLAIGDVRTFRADEPKVVRAVMAATDAITTATRGQKRRLSDAGFDSD